MQRQAMTVLDLYFVGRVVVVCTICFSFTACFLAALAVNSRLAEPDLESAWLALAFYGVISTMLLVTLLRDKLKLVVSPEKEECMETKACQPAQNV
jgi:hypothetical protein